MATVQVVDRERVRIADVHGDIDFAVAEKLGRILRGASQGCPCFVVCVEPTAFVDSAGVSLLIRLRRGFKGQFAVACAEHSQLRRILNITGLEQLLSPFNDVSSACASFANAA